MIVTVSNTSDLLKALGSAHAGDTIQLSAGNYDQVNLSNVSFSGQVTITSADSAHPATINGINLKSDSGLIFKNLNIQYSSSLGSAAVVTGSSNITFDGDNVQSSASNRVGTGIFLTGDDHITVENSNIHDLEDGVAHVNSTYITVTNNQIHDVINDGVRGGGSSNVTITNNTFTNFHVAQAAHNDAIQFWTTNTSTSVHDITITGNTMIRGDGDPVQGVFMGNENGLTYQNVTIADNALIGEAWHSITVNQASNLKISDNLVAGYSDMKSWIMVENSNGATLTNNQSTDYVLQDNTNLTQSGDVTIPVSAIGDTSDLTAWLQTHASTGSTSDSSSAGSSSTGSSSTGSSSTDASSTPPASTPTSPTQTAPADPVTSTSTAETLTGAATGYNHLRGADAGDSIVGGTGFNDINGKQGDDTVVGKSTVGDWLLGGQGNDSIDASASTGHNLFNGNLGNDTLVGGAGAETLRGGQGDDVIHVGSGNAWVSGDLGDNTIYGGQGSDTFHAGAGHDVVQGWHTGDHVLLDHGVTATATTQVGGDVHVSLSNGGEIDLVGVQLSSLKQTNWILQ